MTLCRFVDRRGWEKWVEVDDPLPNVWLIYFPPDIRSLTLPKPADPMPMVERKVFHLQPFNVHPWPREYVYVEDAITLDDADRFAPHIPSLHREKVLRTVLHEVENCVQEVGRSRNALVEFIEAHAAVATIEQTMRRWRRNEREGWNR